MPLYEYECKSCGHRFEKIQKFSDPLETQCPKCGGPIEQVLSAPAVQFKGSGWYVTDYGRKGTSASKPAGEGSKKSETSSDASSKPESTPSKPDSKK